MSDLESAHAHTSEGGCCGPEVWVPLVSLLRTVIEDYGRLPAHKKGAQWLGIGDWDIDPLYQNTKKIIPPNCGGPSNGPCDNTVSVFGRCFQAGEVNYTLYGVIESLIGAESLGSDLHRAYWLKKYLQNRGTFGGYNTESLMVAAGRAYVEGGNAAFLDAIEKIPGRPCAKCQSARLPYHWRYTWWPFSYLANSRY